MKNTTDVEYRLSQYIKLCVNEGYHLNAHKCPIAKVNELRRVLRLPLDKDQYISYKGVFKLIYSMWLKLGMDEANPDVDFKWTLYYDLKGSKGKVGKV